MSDDNNNTADLSTETPTENTVEDTSPAEVSQDQLERKSLDDYKDDYDRKVDDILDRYYAKKEDKPMPEPETLREGESWDKIYNEVPENVQRAMASLRADYTRKTQELAEQRKTMSAEKEKLDALRMNLEDNAAYKAIQEAAVADTGDFDPYDTQSFERYVNRVVAERLQAVLQPMAEQQMQAQAKAKVQNFMSQHPELQTDEMFKGEVRKTLLDNENLTLQDAYWIVKGRQSHQTAERQQMQQLAFQQAAQAAGMKVGVGQNKGITVPKGSDKMSASDLYNHLLKQKK
tara:strand:+ start:1271 stop:2137 length:867 start_codon:yes stop_codon:yes gene_type:complete